MTHLIRLITLALALHTHQAACTVAQTDTLAPEAIAYLGELSVPGWYDWPRQTIIVDDRDGTIYPIPMRWLPRRCRPAFEDQVTVVS